MSRFSSKLLFILSDFSNDYLITSYLVTAAKSVQSPFEMNLRVIFSRIQGMKMFILNDESISTQKEKPLASF